jgi:hypothetical protein
MEVGLVHRDNSETGMAVSRTERIELGGIASRLDRHAASAGIGNPGERLGSDGTVKLGVVEILLNGCVSATDAF